MNETCFKTKQTEKAGSLPITFNGFESCNGLWNLSSEEAIQPAYGMLVVLPRCLLMIKIMHIYVYIHDMLLKLYSVDLM